MSNVASTLLPKTATLSKQRSTLSKGRNFNAKLVRHCCLFWQQRRTLFRHCCQKRQHCRSNIRHCSIRQCCFDIVAGVDRALVRLSDTIGFCAAWCHAAPTRQSASDPAVWTLLNLLAVDASRSTSDTTQYDLRHSGMFMLRVSRNSRISAIHGSEATIFWLRSWLVDFSTFSNKFKIKLLLYALCIFYNNLFTLKM